SWAVVPESIPKDLLITCMSEDQVVMGLKHKYLPLEGVQFHPESFLTNIGSDLVRNWLAL
ncbi:MAG: aminodeoxychorismate/anthranilate synthase component II, partial [Saprospiraceae bacterium]